MSVFDSAALFVYCSILALALGAVFGSFLNCAAWRVVRGESFTKGRSRCPSCGHELGIPDLVPILSWLFLKGRCRYCGEKISPRYVFVEVLMALLTLACLLRFDLSVLALRNWIFVCCLFCLSLVDLDSFEIPDACLLIAALAWLVSAPFLGLWPKGMLAGLLAALIYGGALLVISLVLDRVLKKESLGGGDIKLFALVALYLGPVGALFALILACLLGILSIPLLKRKAEGQFPFGPAISLAAVIMLFCGEGLVNWYSGLLSFA